jgi:hypothetical protein
MEWWNEYNSGFMISVLTILVGGMTLCVKSCLASKCSRTNVCCGCLLIERDTNAEEEIEIATLNRRNYIPAPTKEEEEVV